MTFELGSTLRGAVRTLAIVLGDQLDRHAPLLEGLDPEQDAILMMEVREEATHVPSHAQRTALFLSAMRHFASELDGDGFRIRYVRLDAPRNTHDFTGEVRRAVEILSPDRLALTMPGEWRVRDRAVAWEDELGLPVTIYPDTHFTSSLEEFSAWAEGRKNLVQEYFYREQRKKLGILVDENGKPRGGRWNYDSENREAFRAAPRAPRPYLLRTDEITREVLDLVRSEFPDAPGQLDSFVWPVTRAQARRALESFIENRLARFGDRQDAMWSGEPWLYHSLLSSSLNLKLLRVEECVEAALEALEEGRAPLNSVEGFIRQLIGWREFIRGVYWNEGSGYLERNALEHHGSLPDFYWTGKTEMNCLRESIGQVLEYGYGHHIQRLMVTGNFALMAGIRPREVADWYLGMYVDGIDWVTAPNTLGMSLHADGGVVGTKPYSASGRYIDRMSNYCEGCRYDPRKRVPDPDGDDTPPCPFTTFYWDFLIRHRERFSSNHRMGRVLKNLERIDDSEQDAIRKQADDYREEFGIGSIEARGSSS